MQVRRAGREDVPAAAAALAGAFSQDPVWSWVVGHEPGAPRLVPYFAGLLGTVLRRPDAELHVVDDGAALWFPPGRWRLSAAEQVRTFPGGLRATGVHGARRGLAVEAASHRVHPERPHAYLHYLGAAQQGTGRGSALLADMTARLDREGTPAYLESSNPRNTPLYERYGFRASGTVDVPAGCPPLLPMWREPA